MSTARTRPMQHIDRHSLYTNLEARIRYLHSFLDFGANDIEALRSGAKYVQALTPAVVNIVYRKLLQYDITARAFTTRSTAFEGPMDPDPDETSPQILHRKSFLRAYLRKLCSDPTQMEFWEYLDKVGMMHTGQGRAHPLHVEYVHIGAALAVIQDVLTEAILSHPRLPLARKTALVKALGKVIWIQNDLFAKWYVRDGQDEHEQGVDPIALQDGGGAGSGRSVRGQQQREEKKEEGNQETGKGGAAAAVMVEKEGWLHGKRVLAPDEDGEEEDDGVTSETSSDGTAKPGSLTTDGKTCRIGAAAAAPAGGGPCPFTGLVTAAEGLPVKEENKEAKMASGVETKAA